MNDKLAMLADCARQYLAARPEEAVDRFKIDFAIRQCTKVVSSAYGCRVTEEDIAAAARDLETRFVVEQGPSVELVDGKLTDWYTGERRNPGKFMSRYLSKLAKDRWPIASVNELEDSTARVLEMLDDPRQDGTWQRRGLVVGDVQSGKTAHYAGVINRAADAGFQAIVVLSGMHNLLRLQVQQRLDASFTGRDTRKREKQGADSHIGVGVIDPRPSVDTFTWADLEEGDFSGNISHSVTIHAKEVPILLVVKKNAAILKNLNKWVKNNIEYKKMTLLLIDDEADQASVDTNDQEFFGNEFDEKNYEPTRINAEIRTLLLSFDRSAFVAYTATPFANILIHDARAAEGYGKDLFPSTFILSLSPPDDYFGASAVFGTYDEGADENKGLELVRYVYPAKEDWIPEGHQKTHKPSFQGKTIVPTSL